MNPEFQHLAQGLCKTSAWLPLLQAKRADHTLPNLKKGEFSEVAKGAEQDMATKRASLALARLRLAAFIDPQRLVREVRRMGCFRGSKYRFEVDPVIYVVAQLIKDADALGFDAGSRSYLNSVANLLSLGPSAAKLASHLANQLRGRQDRILKSLFVMVDQGFRPPASKTIDPLDELAQRMGLPSHFLPEQRASGLSTLLTMFERLIGIRPEHLRFIDEHGIQDGSFERLLIDASKLDRLCDVETLIDAFPFTVTQSADSLVLAAIDPQLERSIRLGYIQTNLQAEVRRYNTEQADLSRLWSLEELANSYHNAGGAKVVMRRREPVDRYVVALLPAGPLLDLLQGDQLFREEVVYLEGVAIDAFAGRDWVYQADIQPGLRLIDLIKAQRFFVFLARVMFLSLDQHPADDGPAGMDMRSRLPVFAPDLLEQALGQILGVVPARKILAMLTFDAKSKACFDIQYRPILKVDGWLLIPLSVLWSSNIVRNVLCAHRTRLLPADGHDPMQRAIELSLRARGFLVAVETQRDVDERPLEIDVLAYSDSVLFIFECKNAFHPCSPHEMRTSYDHIQKAGRQLTRARAWLSSTEQQCRLFKELGWQVELTPNILTGVITANRIFTSYVVDGHPVRQAHEMKNILDRGTINLQGTVYRIWRNEEFDVMDLVAYVRGETVVRDCLESMVEQTLHLDLGRGALLTIQTYGLELNRLGQITAARYLAMESGSPTSPETTPGDPGTDTPN